MLRLYNISVENKDDVCIDKEQCMIPVKIKQEGKLITYGYQDNEANRELRMLKELRRNKDALQFTDVFPEYKEVVICGCNELAVSFAAYLEEQGITVFTIGKHWDYFNYTSNNKVDLSEEENGRLIIFAEGGALSSANDLIQKMKRSVSPEFECIDRIYEENVVKGRIKDTIGTFDEFIHQLKGMQEIVILGDDRKAQDTYDLLMKHGIDICSFVVKEQKNEMLLGKTVMSVTDAMSSFQNPVFLNCKDTHGALGEEWTEYFDYHGYERNKQYFLIRDYTDIPESNLVHVLRSKRVLLTGDKRLCRLLSDYLYQIENAEVTVQYVPLAEKVLIEKDDILCLVIPDYHTRLKDFESARKDKLTRQLADMGFAHYTEYFISSSSFALIDNYLNRDIEKYQISELTPKGILMGRIPAWSGNNFLRGIMDGHPEMLCIPYSDFNENLFYYCVRLANCDADNILAEFWEIYNEETGSKERYFPLCDKFEVSVKRLLRTKRSFTSQELFVLFHIAYAEMLSDKIITDVSKLIIYWEPHFVPRNNFPFFALWLEDKKVMGQTIILRRNNIVRTGSCCSRAADKRTVPHAFAVMFLDESLWDGVDVRYHYWTEYKMRFEDIKIKPREKLMEICDRFGMSWSDNMMQTTTTGKPLVYRGSVDFDLKAVFNQYADYLSEFDRFRVSIASSCYQKKYGYSYQNCLKFSRRELQELFFKPFLFEEKKIFEEEKNYSFEEREWVRWQLWNVRKHMVLADVHPEFDRFDVEQTGEMRIVEYDQKAVDETIKYINMHDKLIIYGTGKDCQSLLELVDEKTRSLFLYSDKRAETEPYVFQGKTVISPKELCDRYKNYNILVTSSLYYLNIQNEFNRMGIDHSRVFYNRARFVGMEK